MTNFIYLEKLQAEIDNNHSFGIVNCNVIAIQAGFSMFEKICLGMVPDHTPSPVIYELMPWANLETLLRKHYVSHQCFHVCPPRKTLLRKQNLLPRKQKCFPTNSETFLLRKQCFVVCPHVFKWFRHKKHCFSD